MPEDWPFEWSEDDRQEYICEGLSNDIINNLYKMWSFEKVVPFYSVLTYKVPDRNIQGIAEELGVNYILDGSYMKMGNKFKITAQLIEATTDNHLLLGEYELPYTIP